jgi:endogenous inhibitor of DNA gyrase (YacG/DUF329 family)
MSDDPNISEKPAASEKRCPICGRPRDLKYDPFCSRRCADVDLHRWLKGTYVIPGAERPSVEGDKADDEE